MLDGTKNCAADFYLDDSGNEISRDEFLEENKEWHGHMLYVGGGICPLKVAVLTYNARGVYGPDWGVAVSTAEYWATRTGRSDWFKEEYQLHIEDIPAEV